MKLFLIYGIFIVAFFANFFVDKGIIPAQLTVATELLIYLLAIYSLIFGRKLHAHFRIHLLPLFAFFILAAFCSAAANHMLNLRPLFSLRLIFRFFVFYWTLINLGLNDGELKKINRLIFFLFIIQLPYVAYRFHIWGINERTIGTWADHGGGNTTLIPVIALGYLAGFFGFYKAKRVYLLLAVGFVLLGIVGAKAALLFIYPIAFFGLYYLIYIKGKGINIRRDLPIIALIAVFSIVIMAGIIKYQPRLNEERKVGGTVDFFYALGYSKEYTKQTTGEYGGGRIATTKLVFKTLYDGGLQPIFFGYGPGSLTRSILDANRHIDYRIYQIAGSYGVTGMTHVLIEYGIFGLMPLSLMFFIFIHMCFKWYKLETEVYWKALATGSLFFAVYNTFIFFAYNVLPIIGDLVPPIYFYAMAVAYIRLDQIQHPANHNILTWQSKPTHRLS